MSDLANGVGRRALVIGAQTGGLRGAERDAEAMGGWLQARGYAVDLRTAGDATRAGMLEGWDRLIRDSRWGDAAVVYFAGHGGLATGRRGEGGPTEVGFVVPTDAAGSGFPGISEWEIALRLAALTARTPHVVAIHDCCHGEAVARGEGGVAVARTLARRVACDVAGHLRALAAGGALIDTLQPRGNPLAVRLAAARREQLAWERPDAHGVVRGAFTSALLAVLDELGAAAATWAWLIHAVRARLGDVQRPELQGPAQRVVFSRATVAEPDLAVVSRARGGVVVAAGRASGVAVGDRLAVGRVDALAGFAPLAEATVTDVGAFAATLARAPAGATAARIAGIGDRAARLRGLRGDGLAPDAITVAGAAVTNRSDRVLYAHVFAVAGGDVVRLTELASSGLAIAPGASAELPGGDGLGERFVIATTAPVDLGLLASPPPAAPADTRTALPPAERLAVAIAATDRDAVPPAPSPARAPGFVVVAVAVADAVAAPPEVSP